MLHRTSSRKPVVNWFLLLVLLLSSTFLPPQHIVFADGETSLPAQMNKRFTPDLIPAGGEALLSVNIYNPNYFPLTLTSVPAAWVDTLPDGVTFREPRLRLPLPAVVQWLSSGKVFLWLEVRYQRKWGILRVPVPLLQR